MRCNTKPGSALGSPVVTVLHQGGAETPALLPLGMPTMLLGPACPQLPHEAMQDASDKVWGWWHPQPSRGAGDE